MNPATSPVFSSPSSPFPCSSPYWQMLQSTTLHSPIARCNHGTVLIHNRYLLLIGGRGYGRDARYNDVHAFDVEKRVWLKSIVQGEAPPPSSSFSLNALGNTVYFYGGKASYPYDVIDDMYTLTVTPAQIDVDQEMTAAPEATSLQTMSVLMDDSPKTDGLLLEWRRLRTFSNEYRPKGGRFLHATCVIGTKIYIFGGQINDQTMCNDLYVFSTNDHSWQRAMTTGNAPKQRARHSMVSCGSRIYVFGGMDNNDNIFGDLHTLDMHTMHWTQIPFTPAALATLHYDNPPPLAGHTACSLGSKFIVFGGMTNVLVTDGESVNWSYLFDTITLTWSKLNYRSDADGCIIPEQRNGHRVVVRKKWDGSFDMIVSAGWKRKYLDDLLVMNTSIRDGLFVCENNTPALFSSKNQKEHKRIFAPDIEIEFAHMPCSG